MGLKRIIVGAVEEIKESIDSAVDKVVGRLRSIYYQVKGSYDQQRALKQAYAERIRTIRPQVDALCEEIRIAADRTHIGTEQACDAVLAASKRLEKAVNYLESMDLLDDFRI